MAGRKTNARATRMEESSAKERRMEGKKGIGGKRAGHDEDEAEARRGGRRGGWWLEKVDGARTACPHRPMRQVVLTAMG